MRRGREGKGGGDGRSKVTDVQYLLNVYYKILALLSTVHQKLMISYYKKDWLMLLALKLQFVSTK